MKRLVDIPIKSSKAEAKAMIRAKLASGDLSLGDERRLKDMYKEYAKGGDVTKKPVGLYANINAKQERIKAGSDEKMRKPGSKGAPTDKAFKEAAKTAKMAKGGSVDKQQAKVAKVMGEFKEGSLHSGKGGKVVKSPKQAIAIALSEAKKAKK
jgi:hypothetical protein